MEGKSRQNFSTKPGWTSLIPKNSKGRITESGKLYRGQFPSNLIRHPNRHSGSILPRQ